MAAGDPANVGHRSPTGAEQEPTSGTDRSSSGPSTLVRAAALTLTVALDAVAFATVLRPRHGYRGADSVLLALALGVGAALGALTIVAAIAALRRRPHESVWAATTALPTLGLVLVVFIAAGASSQVVQALRGTASPTASTPAARADFQRWQGTVVPIVVGWMHAIRADGAFTHNIPAAALGGLRARVDRSQRTLDGLARSLAADSPRLPGRPRLRRLTIELEAALAAAQRAQQTYALALSEAANTGVDRKVGAAQVRALIDRGNAETRQSLSIMTTFSFDANGLGGSLFAEQR